MYKSDALKAYRKIKTAEHSYQAYRYIERLSPNIAKEVLLLLVARKHQ
ncbi:hypothetical protein M3202_19795 [Alkalihalobacillus oceani]|uniref:Uncharacterized protein n=1 Tax=Halalkalibacter oceani TaxID=1653776 RepID=A0A9X2DSH7_9BACI|nr:hypothetical protein [Halalkalibacter oceani]MCM3716291.1 hypothetical protein [Halalkalibacter oceani]